MASKTFRSAVPDLTCQVEQMLVAGDRVTAFLHFRGHFTGTFGSHAGQGQTVDFIAVDIYRVRNGLIAEDWHLEDKPHVDAATWDRGVLMNSPFPCLNAAC